MHRTAWALLLLALVGTGSAYGQQAHVNLDWNPQKNTQNLVPYGANVISPEVRDDRSITFRLRAPQAQRVELSGEPILRAIGKGTGPLPLQKGEDGVWTLTVGPVKPNMYIYRLVIDGVAVPDPNNTLTGFADQPGYSVVVVHGEGPNYFDAHNVPHGAVTRHVYHSDVTNGEREMYVYTPPDYDRSKKYPVLYLTGGSGELASTWNLDGRAGFIADNLIAEGKALPMIIAMPNNQVVHRSDPKHTEQTFKLFEAELRQHIVPLVDKNYGTQADRHGRALAGLSMGGRHAQLVGFKCLDLFTSFGILSAGDPDSEKSTPEFLKDPETNAKVDYLFVGLGTFENTPNNRSVQFHQLLDKYQIKHDYYIGGDSGHDWGTWRAHLLHMLPNLWRQPTSAAIQPSTAQSVGVNVLDYLKSISGKQTVAGMHNREPNSRPATQTDRLFGVVSRYPGLWSGDFLFSADDVKNRWTMIKECKKQWDEGSIVQLMLHVAPPNQGEVCAWKGGVLSRLSDEQWSDLLTDGGALNKAWKSRLDGYAEYLQFLKDNGVQVLFRPHHEMNQGSFWWGGRKGPDGTAKLYRLTHDYLVRVKGLTNLIWVWDMQDMSRDFAEYNPGAGYWDIFAFDVYSDGFNKSWYDYILPIVGDKPMAIGECDRLPTAQMLKEQPRWCFFMSWAELTFNRNSNQQIIDLYKSPNVVTREQLPKFK